MTYIDPVQVSPSNYKLLFEDDTHRVLEMTLKAGERDNEHSHTSRDRLLHNGRLGPHQHARWRVDGCGYPGRTRDGPRGLDTHGREHREQGHQGDHLRDKVAVGRKKPTRPS